MTREQTEDDEAKRVAHAEKKTKHIIKTKNEDQNGNGNAAGKSEAKSSKGESATVARPAKKEWRRHYCSLESANWFLFE